MTPDMLPIAAQAGYLTTILRRSGALGDRSVQEVAVETDRLVLMSRIIRLRIVYDRPAPDAPATVIIKTGLPKSLDTAWHGGQREVEFYTQVAPALSDGVVPRCFDAHWDGDTQAWHLVLEDLTDRYVIVTQWPLPPNQAQCETILTARAKLHAAWWNDPRLGVSVGKWFDAKAIDTSMQDLGRKFAAYVDRLGDNLTHERRDLYECFIAAAPRLYGRYHKHKNVTIVQGDSHVWNCFLSSDGSNDVRFFDWDSWSPHVPSNDLAYMMAMHWYPDRRRVMEPLLLDHYHAVLLAHGVTGYDRRALDEDYRWSVLMRISIPVFQAAAQIPPVVWWNNFERIMMAVDDCGCRDLLG